MKGTIYIKVRPNKEGPRICTTVQLKSVGQLDKLFLLNAFINGIEVSTDEARAFLDMIDAGVVATTKEKKETSHD